MIGNWQQALGYDNQPRLSRPEFLRECDRWLIPQQEEISQRSSRILPSRYLGLFEALDSNHDQQLSKEEFRETMMSWLEGSEWDFITQLNESKDLPSSSKGLQHLLHSLAEATASQSDGIDLGHLIKYLVDRSTSWNDADAALLDALDRYFHAHSRGPRLLTQSPFPNKKADLPWNPALQSIHHRLSPWISWPGHPNYATALEKAARTRNELMEDASIASHAEAYQMVCAGCHGYRGEGLKKQAPPLHKADWVLRSKDRLIRIALHGAHGPIH